MSNFKWVVEIEVSETWVGDGFELTEEKAREMMENALPFASGSEFSIKILQAPATEAIDKAQGGE